MGLRILGKLTAPDHSPSHPMDYILIFARWPILTP